MNSMERKPHGYWTKERILEESKKYSNRVDFKKNAPTAYSETKKHHWFNEMPWIKMLTKPNGYWKVKENVITKSKECKNITEFEKKYSAGYQSALKNGWIDEIKMFYPKLEKYPKPYYIYVYIDNDNKVAYVGLTNDKEERHKTHSTGKYRGRNSQSEVYKYFNANNKLVPNPIYMEGGLTADNASKREKYWKNYYQNNLGYIMLNVAECGNLGGGVLKWTKDKVFEESKKYQTRTDFFHNSNGAYSVATKNKWLDEMVWLISPQKPKNYWTEENVMKECEKYKSIAEMRKSCASSYYAVCKLKLNEKVKQYFKEKNGSLLN